MAQSRIQRLNSQRLKRLHKRERKCTRIRRKQKAVVCLQKIVRGFLARKAVRLSISLRFDPEDKTITLFPHDVLVVGGNTKLTKAIDQFGFAELVPQTLQRPQTQVMKLKKDTSLRETVCFVYFVPGSLGNPGRWELLVSENSHLPDLQGLKTRVTNYHQNRDCTPGEVVTLVSWSKFLLGRRGKKLGGQHSMEVVSMSTDDSATEFDSDAESDQESDF